MRATGAAAILLLAAFAAVAPAGEDPPGPAKKDNSRVYSEEDWIAKVKDLAKVNQVGLKKKDLMEFEAKRSVVRVCVKIWDIRPTREGLLIDVVEVQPSRVVADKDRLPRDPIVLAATDNEVVKDWKRWDRLAFKVKPKVTPDGVFTYERKIASATDIDRVPNPGIEYPPKQRTLTEADGFGAWVEKYARWCEVPDWRSAWKTYTWAASVSFPMTATVRDGAIDAAGRSARGPVSLVFDVHRSTGVTGFGLLDGQGHPTPTARALVEDPQVIEALKPGTRAELWFRVVGFENREDMEIRKGRFRVEVTFGRVK